MKRVLTLKTFKSLIFLSLFVLGTTQSLATTVILPADDDMLVGARAIVLGKVVAIESSFDDRSNRIYTYVTVKVQEVFKGQITERKIVLKELGGQVGDKVNVVFGNPQFKRGERVLLYLDTWSDGSLRTYQMFLGKFNIETDPVTGEEMAVRSSPDENTTILKQQLHGHGTPGTSTERQVLRRYLRMVRNRLAANWQRSLEFEAQVYANKPLLSEPSEFRAIAGHGEVTPNFTFLGPFRFFEPDNGQPVALTLNPNPGSPAVTLNSADVIAAGGAWSNVTGCSLQMAYTGPLQDCYTNTGTPGVHVVSNNCDGRNGATAGCASILAWGGVYQTGPQTRTINGTLFRQSVQGFVSMNPWASCHFSISCNVQEILTHEIGHALGLGHSQFNDATMAAFAHFDGRCASIRTDDINGICAIYPSSGGGGGTLAVVTSTLASGTVNTAYSQTLTASGGTLPYTWSLVPGTGSLPAGLSLSSGGLISGTPTTAGTSNFTVRVTDNPGATATRALSIVVNPSGGGGALNSQFVSQNVPTNLQPGQQFTSTLRFLNTGTQTWSGSAFYFASQNPALNQIWGGNAVSLSGFVTAPGQTLEVSFTAFAPITPGTYNFQWQMYQNNGVTFFGQMSTNVAIQVGSVSTDNASFVSQNVMPSMACSQIYAVSVTMQNTGGTTWTSGAGYKLASQNPTDNTNWAMNRVNLPSSVAPGGQVTFTFNVTAPSTAASYNFQWRMIREGTGMFGATTTNVPVSVQRFSDVLPSHPYYAYIDRIAQLGITVGCTTATYCPDGNVTRAEMAVFIERVFGVFNPPTPPVQRFDDVPPGFWAYAHIGDFATRGITVGCTANNFCPNDSVMRDQMAVFMERAVGRSTWPAPANQRFVDLPPSWWSYAAIESFVANNSSGGILDVIKRDCNADGLHFCPTRPLTRAEMAAWLVIVFNL